MREKLDSISNSTRLLSSFPVQKVKLITKLLPAILGDRQGISKGASHDGDHLIDFSYSTPLIGGLIL